MIYGTDWNLHAKELSMGPICDEEGYGVLSARLPSNRDNEPRHQKLCKELTRLGFNPIEKTSEWRGISGNCWLIHGIFVHELVILARKYGQHAIVFCPPGCCPHILDVDGVPVAPVSEPGRRFI